MNDEREQSTRPADNGASGLAEYRWLLRRLFAGDMTPPPAEDSSRAPIRRVTIQVDTNPSAADIERWRALWDRLLAPPPTEPDEGE
jgi:hypothetical protein